MQHAPPAVGLQLRQLEAPEAVTEEDGNFGRDNGDRDVDEEHECREPRPQSEQDQHSTDDFRAADKWPHDFGRRNSDSRETPGAELI